MEIIIIGGGHIAEHGLGKGIDLEVWLYGVMESLLRVRSEFLEWLRRVQ